MPQVTLTDQQAKYYSALNVLLRSEGFIEELTNANYHSALQFLEEARDQGYYKEW